MDYKHLLIEASYVLEDQPNIMSLLSNASAFIYQSIDRLNWAGFYIMNQGKLTVGPFQGKVACHSIDLGKGVCGESALERVTKVVDDVLSYSNHIACDSHSRSEIVIPIIINDVVFGVLDIDSPEYNRFDHEIVLFFESLVAILVKFIDKSTLLR